VNEEDGNEDLMKDVNWVLYDFGWKGRGAVRLGWGVPVLDHLCPKTKTSRKAAIQTAEYYLLV
jgi:hypothetical protein